MNAMLKDKKQSVTILIADDDPEDREIAIAALKESKVINHFVTVSDGRELLDYLDQAGYHGESAVNAQPSLILLDLNMPRMSGLEALQVIKSDPHLRHIPVVVLTTSSADKDIVDSYSLGVNSYITKPVSFEELVKALSILNVYWFEIVSVPSAIAPNPHHSIHPN